MSKLHEILNVIPRAAKAAAAIISVSLVALLAYVVTHPAAAGEPLPPAAQVLFPIFAFVFLFVLIMLYGYVYGDAKRRGMRYVMWTLLAIFVPDAIGIILYFILRGPLPSVCRTCGARVLAKHAFCPNCGTAARTVCPKCGKPVELDWSNCGFCGATLAHLRQVNA